MCLLNGVSLSWSISSSQEKKSVLLEWNTQPEKCSTGKSGKSQKSPCRRRRDAQRFQVWKEKRERTSDSKVQNPVDQGRRTRGTTGKCRIPCATQTAHPGVTSKGVQALCPVPSHTWSTQCETVSRSSQTWIVTCDQNTQSVGSNPQPSIRQLNPRCVESNGLEFPDQPFIDSLVRERTDPGELPTLPKIKKKNFPNNNKTVTLKVLYGQQTYEGGMWPNDNLVSEKLRLIKHFQLFGTYPSACYLLTSVIKPIRHGTF